MVTGGRFTAAAATVIAIAAAVYVLSDVAIILGISLLASLVLEPATDFAERHTRSRTAAVVSVYAVTGSFLYLGISTIIPKLLSELNGLAGKINPASLENSLTVAERALQKYLPFVTTGTLVSHAEQFINTAFMNTINGASSFLGGLFSAAAVAVIIPFTTYFMLKDKARIIYGLLNFMPNKYFEMAYYTLGKVSVQLSRFVRGWLLDALFVGTACGLAFYFAGIEDAAALGVIAGAGHLIPYFGPIIGGIPAMLISVVQYGDVSRIPAIIVLLLAIYAADNGIVQPYVFSKSVGMHPLMIIILIIAGSQIGGLAGMLLAVPAATVAKTATTEFYFAYKQYQIARI